MDASKARHDVPGEIRTVRPFDDADDMEVDLRILSPTEDAGLLDSAGLKAKDKLFFSKVAKTNPKRLLRRIVGWRNYTRDGEPIPFTEAEVLKFQTEKFHVDGEWQTLWDLCIIAENTQVAEEAGNSERS